MKKIFVLLGIVFTSLLLSFPATAQNAITTASPEEQARIKPLVAAETKARESLNAKIATLPQSKAFQDAQEKLKLAQETFNKAIEKLDIPEARALKTARDDAQRALDALNKSVEQLPENATWKEAGAKTLDAAYSIMAGHKLSSREFKPELNAQGELVFPPIKPTANLNPK